MIFKKRIGFQGEIKFMNLIKKYLVAKNKIRMQNKKYKY